MSGFGSQPCGSSSYGLGAPATAEAQGGAILRDENTGVSTGSRYIDQDSKDYLLDEHGRILGMSDTYQLVQYAVSTTKGTSAVRTLGHELFLIDRVTSNTQARIEASLRSALQHLVDFGLIEFLGVDVEVVRPGAVLVYARWRDVATGEVQFTALR